MENKLQGLGITDPPGCIIGQHTHINGFVFHSLRINTGAIINNLNYNGTGLLSGGEGKRPRIGFTRSQPIRRYFNTMIATVSDDVGQRILEGRQNGTIQFRVLTFHHDLYFLVQLAPHVPDHARYRAPDAGNRLHSRFQELFLQMLGNMVDVAADRYQMSGIGMAGRRRGRPMIGKGHGIDAVDNLHQPIARQYQFADLIHQRIQDGEFNADRFLHMDAARRFSDGFNSAPAFLPDGGGLHFGCDGFGYFCFDDGFRRTQ